MSQPYYVLEIRYPGGAAETHEISDERKILGRSKVKAELQINDKKVSGRHCEIRFVAGNLTVADLGSTNGTLFNGQKAKQFALAPGGSFKMGDATLRILAIHGIETEADAARTVVSAPSWAEEEESTRALSAEQIAQVVAAANRQQGPEPAYAEPVYAEPAYAEPAEPVYDEPVYDEPVYDEAAYAPTQPAPGPQGGGYEAPTPAHAPQEPVAPDGYAQPAEDDWAAAARQAPSQPGPSASSPPSPMARFGEGRVEGPVEAEFSGTGLELLKIVLLGVLFCVLTLYIYTPWLIVKLAKWYASRTKIVGGNGAQLHVNFTGKGRELVGPFFLGALLCLVTLYIYLPWFIVKITRWLYSHTQVTTDDGDQYDLSFELTGGQLFKFVLVNGLLTLITGGIYGAWMWCKSQAMFMSATFIEKHGQRVGTLEFTGGGGAFFILFLWNYLLTAVTAGIWGAWFVVNVLKFQRANTHVHVNQRTFSGSFHGKGFDYLKIQVVGFLLTVVTLGIYGYWWSVKKTQFEYHGTRFDEAG